MAFECNR